MGYKTIEEVPVWQKAHRLTLAIYGATKYFPRNELYGLIDQLRRSASSVPANITEGFYRNTTKELIQFLYTARGSSGEVLYHLILAKDLGYIKEDVYQHLRVDYEDVIKQINGWIRSLKKKL